MRLATAQIRCTIGDIQSNLKIHYKAVTTAIKNKVELIIFPELSLTGYCREDANSLAFTLNDNRLDGLIKLAHTGNITLIVGAPIAIDNNLYIGSFIIHPDKSIQIYTKQHLHGDEALFFNSSQAYNPLLRIKGQKMSLAICADINFESHFTTAKQNNCVFYLPSIFYSDKGIINGHEQLQRYANTHQLNILMSNYVGNIWNTQAGGKSAFWNSKGQIIGCLSSNQCEILILENYLNEWTANAIKI